MDKVKRKQGLLLIMLVFSCIFFVMSKQRAYADQINNKRVETTQAESTENIEETETMYESETIDESLLAVPERVEDTKIPWTYVLPLGILGLVILGSILVLLKKMMGPPSGSSVNSLLEEYKNVYDVQHRFYAYCSEELLRLERYDIHGKFTDKESIKSDLSKIYNERIENHKKMESFMTKSKIDRNTYKEFRTILRMEREHLRRMENHLRILKEHTQEIKKNKTI